MSLTIPFEVRRICIILSFDHYYYITIPNYYYSVAAAAAVQRLELAGRSQHLSAVPADGGGEQQLSGM